jgi:acetoin:2,6-dichlorophenolindophenol oxidoreductase subunit alpha
MKTRFDAYKRMVLLRVAEEELAKLFLRDKIMSFVHFYVGQEAVAVGVSNALRSADRALGNHRSHGHYLAKGGNLRSMICEILGKAEGFAGGKGGSMHMIARSEGFTGSTPILGSTTSIAAGSAFAQKQQANQDVTVAYIGDGASEEGGFYETLNLAALFKLPLLIVVENNLYAVNSKLLDRRSADYCAEGIVRGFGVAYAKADGNDYDDVYSKATELLAGVRQGKPAVLECVAYRHMAHSAPLFDDAQGYREEDVLERRLEQDCLKKIKERLLTEDISEESLSLIVNETREYVNAEIEYAVSAPYPSPKELHRDLYA